MRVTPPPTIYKVPSPEATLRRLFLTVFLRGQSARGLTKETAPKSLAAKLGWILFVYAALGLSALLMIGQPTLLLSIMLHSITFLALGMFVASSAGEALFNKEESEILMHRPVTSQMLLRAKSTVLVQISLYMAFAVNLVGLGIGITASDGGLLFPFVHLVSTVESALFCIGIVVLMYQLCLRWIGRERLEGVMTTMQVVVIVCITVGSQVLPRVMGMNRGVGQIDAGAWWLKLLPPTWFAALDDAVAGTRSSNSWMLACAGMVATGFILWLGFGKMASVYESGVQILGESNRTRPKQQNQIRLLRALSESALLRPFLRSSVAKASFQLVSAYMFRDRDTKLRLYPGIAPMMVMPVTMLAMNHGFGSSRASHAIESGMGGFFVAFSAAYLCIVPLSALNLIKFSQQYRAAEVFIAAPIVGPAPLLQGARVAVMFFLCVPMLIMLLAFVVIMEGPSSVWLILPGVIAMPAYALIPGIIGNATPLSNPMEEAKSMNNMPIMMLSTFGAMGIGGVATTASSMGFLAIFLIIETISSVALCCFLYSITKKATWRVYD